MNRVSVSLGLLCVLGFVASTIPGGATTSGAPLDLAISTDMGTYNLGEPISMTVAIDNVSADVQSVSAFDVGNLSVFEVSRNGVPITPSQSIVLFSQDPFIVQEDSLVTLAVGEQATIPYDVDVDGTAGYLLTTPILNTATVHDVLIHALTGPGTYALRLQYQYTGPDAGFPNVFHGVLTSNEVTFNVQ